MEPEIRARYNDGILHEAMRRYGIAPDDIHILDGFESYIYEFERGGCEYILRIGHSRRRSVDLIRGEVDWINYLARGGAGVAQAILSDNGALVESIDDDQGGQFLVTAFDKAQGRPAWEVGWTPALYEYYGQTLGRIHALSRTYAPPDPAWRRPEWDAPGNLELERWLPPSETVALEKFRHIKAHLDALPRDAASYGLIHQDAHSANFLVDDNGRITLFDFDDCVYGWYVYDVAMVIFYMLVPGDEPERRAREFWPPFWAGYCREYALDPAWLAEIPTFLKFREVDLYGVIHRSFEDVAHIDDSWTARYMLGRKARIENDVPLVAFDFAPPG
jgi:Ser/Thr protein kinase RdoA (MazF antagonist)